MASQSKTVSVFAKFKSFIGEAKILQIKTVVTVFFILFLAGIATLLYMQERKRYLDSERGKQFPYKAYLNGEVLTLETGHPIRFRTREEADRYAQDYVKP